MLFCTGKTPAAYAEHPACRTEADDVITLNPSEDTISVSRLVSMASEASDDSVFTRPSRNPINNFGVVPQRPTTPQRQLVGIPYTTLLPSRQEMGIHQPLRTIWVSQEEEGVRTWPDGGENGVSMWKVYNNDSWEGCESQLSFRQRDRTATWQNYQWKEAWEN